MVAWHCARPLQETEGALRGPSGPCHEGVYDSCLVFGGLTLSATVNSQAGDLKLPKPGGQTQNWKGWLQQDRAGHVPLLQTSSRLFSSSPPSLALQPNSSTVVRIRILCSHTLLHTHIPCHPQGLNMFCYRDDLFVKVGQKV